RACTSSSAAKASARSRATSKQLTRDGSRSRGHLGTRPRSSQAARQSRQEVRPGMTADSTVTIEPPPEELAALESAEAYLHDAEPQAILEWLFARYPQDVTLASAFGNTSDIVL